MVLVAPDVAAKLALIEAFAAAGISKTEFAKRMSKDERESAGCSIGNTQPNLRRSPQRF
jgi:hypothetical protein